MGARTCTACRAELSPEARFCHRCGASAAPGAVAAGGATRPEKTAWMVAGGLVLFLMAIVAYRVLTGTTAGSMIESMGYVNFYLLTTAVAMPGVFLFWYMIRSGLADVSMGTAGKDA